MNTDYVDDIAPIAQRIDQAKAHKGEATGIKLSWSRLAQEIGLTVTAPNNWKKGKISSDTIEAIAHYTGVDLEWLKTGTGSMLPDSYFINITIPYDTKEHLITEVEAYAKKYIEDNFEQIFKPFGLNEKDTNFKVINRNGPGVSLQRLYTQPDLFIKKSGEEGVYAVVNIKVNNGLIHIHITNRNFKIPDKDRSNNVKLPDSIIKQVPILSYVQAGAFKEAIQEKQDEYVSSYLNNLSDFSFGLIVQGSSMSPDFKEGDKIIVDPNVHPKPGDFVIAQNGGNEATFKKYRPRGFDENGREYFELVPINEEYPTMDSRFQDIQIIGTVVEHTRALRRM